MELNYLSIEISPFTCTNKEFAVNQNFSPRADPMDDELCLIIKGKDFYPHGHPDPQSEITLRLTQKANRAHASLFS